MLLVMPLTQQIKMIREMVLLTEQSGGRDLRRGPTMEERGGDLRRGPNGGPGGTHSSGNARRDRRSNDPRRGPRGPNTGASQSDPPQTPKSSASDGAASHNSEPRPPHLASRQKRGAPRKTTC